MNHPPSKVPPVTAIGDLTLNHASRSVYGALAACPPDWSFAVAETSKTLALAAEQGFGLESPVALHILQSLMRHAYDTGVTRALLASEVEQASR